MHPTPGTLLGGKLHYAQFETGYRTGIEPVLMAAAIPARPGQTILEAGCGAGAALLCLLHRVPGAQGLGIERDPDLAALARNNLAANTAQNPTAEIITADILTHPPSPHINHVMANPPWRDPASTPSPDPKRRLALQGHGADWIPPLAAWLAPRGTLTLIVPATACAASIAALRDTGLRRITLCPLWPRQGTDARLLLLQATQGPDTCRITPGLTLHEGPTYTPAAQSILRDGNPLPLTPTTPRPTVRHDRA